MDGSLERLADFLRVDPDLLQVAAEASGDRDMAIAAGGARTAGALLAAAQEAAEKRRRAARAKAETERKRREHEAAVARSKYLDDLSRRESSVWTEIENLIATKQPASYDRAVVLLIDLRDLAAVQKNESSFHDQFEALRMRHARKPSLLLKIERAIRR